MYVMNCERYYPCQDATGIDRRTLYKTGKRKPSWLKYESHREVANKLAKACTTTNVTEQRLLGTVKNNCLHVYHSTQGKPIVSPLLEGVKGFKPPLTEEAYNEIALGAAVHIRF